MPKESIIRARLDWGDKVCLDTNTKYTKNKSKVLRELVKEFNSNPRLQRNIKFRIENTKK